MFEATLTGLMLSHSMSGSGLAIPKIWTSTIVPGRRLVFHMLDQISKVFLDLEIRTTRLLDQFMPMLL